MGIMLTSLGGEAIKMQVGRLRPIFLELCKPNMTIARCVDDNNLPRLVSENVCQETDQSVLWDLRLVLLFESDFAGRQLFS